MDDEEGLKTRREVLGDEHVERATSSAGAFAEPFQDFITKYAWGAVWSRPGLDRRTRSAITLAALVSVRAETELALHVRGALRNGLSPEEIATAVSIVRVERKLSELVRFVSVTLHVPSLASSASREGARLAVKLVEVAVLPDVALVPDFEAAAAQILSESTM